MNEQLPILPPAITIVVVSESGASIYSASEVAREEFPNLDLTVRGAILRMAAVSLSDKPAIYRSHTTSAI